MVFAVCVVVYLIAWGIYGFRPNASLFVAASGLAGVTTLLLNPFLTPMIIEADPSRRAGMQSAGAQILGGAAGPLLAALLVSDADVRGVLVLGAAALVAGFGMILGIHLTAKRE